MQTSALKSSAQRLGSHRAFPSAHGQPLVALARHGFNRKRAALAAVAAVSGASLIQEIECKSGLGVRCVPTPQNLRFLESVKAFRMPYVLFPQNGDGHLETLAGALIRERPAVPYRRELLTAADGGTVSLDWHVPADGEQADPSTPVLILIAGLTGGSDARYVRHAVIGAAKRGMRVVVYNHCGVCGSPATSPRLYSACYTEDLRLAISHISRLFPTAPLLSAAFSIGANVLVHYLAEEADARSAVTASSSSSSSNRTSSVLKDGVRSSSDGVGSTSGASRAGPLVAASAREKDKVSPRPQLTAAVSLCNPFNLTLGDWNWRRPDAGFRRAYDRYLAARMSDVFSQNWEVLAAGAASQPPPTPGSRRVPDQNADVGSLESSSVYPVASSSSSSESDGTAGLQEGALLGGTTRRPSMGAAHSGRSSSIMQKGNYSQQRVPNDGRPDMPITAEDQAALAAASGVHVASNSSSSSSSSSSSNSGGSSALDSSGDRLAAGHEHAVPLSGDSGRNSGTSSSSSSSSSSNTSTESVRGQSSSSPALYCSSLSFHARDSRNWPIRIPKPLVTVRPATIRPEDARRAPTVRDFDDAATRHWFGFYSVDEYYAAASSAYHLDAVDIPLLCISAEDDPICPKEAIPIEAFDKNPHLMLIITPTGGHLGWIDLNPGGGGWRGRPWTEDVMLEYLQAVLAQERNARNNV